MGASRLVAFVLALCAVSSMTSVALADTVHLYAAGSLRAALNDVAKAFEEKTANKVEAKYGPSGILKNEIAGGVKADVFASANMEHPRALSEARKSGPVVLFTRNKLCALVKPGLNVTSANLLDRMLDPAVKLGTSTPRADPSGDYAWEVFRKAEAVRPGAYAQLDAKALQLIGGPSSQPPPEGRTIYSVLIERGAADIYCTGARGAL